MDKIKMALDWQSTLPQPGARVRKVTGRGDCGPGVPFVPLSQGMSARMRAEIEREGMELVEMNRAARLRLLGAEAAAAYAPVVAMSVATDVAEEKEESMVAGKRKYQRRGAILAVEDYAPPTLVAEIRAMMRAWPRGMVAAVEHVAGLSKETMHRFRHGMALSMDVARRVQEAVESGDAERRRVAAHRERCEKMRQAMMGNTNKTALKLADAETLAVLRDRVWPTPKKPKLAEALKVHGGIGASTLNKLKNGRAGITLKMARKLAAALDDERVEMMRRAMVRERSCR